jgi:hypothetical protein
VSLFSGYAPDAKIRRLRDRLRISRPDARVVAGVVVAEAGRAALATMARAIFCEASSIISSPNMTAPRACTPVTCLYASTIRDARASLLVASAS